MSHALRSSLLLLTLFLVACSGAATAAADETVWTSRDQFVTVVPREAAPGANEPADLTAAQVAAALASLQVVSADGKTPLFDTSIRQLLAPHLAEGLRRAGRDRDVAFAVTGYSQPLLGLFRRPHVTTGRVFVEEGRLNLIVGMVHEEVRETDRRLQPFTPGSRREQRSNSIRLASTSPDAVVRGSRADWAAVAIPSVTAATEPAPPPVPAAAIPAVPAPQASAAAPVARTPQERLLLLKQLHEAALLTDDEYRSKRREIIDGL